LEVEVLVQLSHNLIHLQMVLIFHLWTNRCNDCERAVRAYYSLAAVYKILLLQSVIIPVIWCQCWCSVLQGQQALQQIITVILGKETNVESSGAVPCKVARTPTVTACEWGLSGVPGIDVHGDAQR